MELVRQIEALLFVADEPVSAIELAQFLDVEESDVVAAVQALEQLCEDRAVQVVRIAGGYQFSTRPRYAEMIGRFLRPSRNKLTRSQMEVLAIVAYQQPVTIAEVDAVRGVHSDHPMRCLLDRRLVHELGRKQTPGRPILYGTSEQFLHLFNLESLEALPPVVLPAVDSDDSQP
ncbi:MAG: SMC-Scp complex subunit ScpB [Chthonomonas sp.]|nr:SMC-Scp complex subunit ScpB [Chthonomonas sp.]